MQQTFTIAESAELAVVERSGFVESRHGGSAIVLDPAGEVRESFGDPSGLILPRSSLKPLQAAAMLAAGAALEGERLGLATASHSGTDRHVAVVRDILAAASVTEHELACPPALASDSATRDAMIRADAGPERVRMNCSGKHAGMLAACTAAGLPHEGYLDPAHPLQTHIREIVERLTGEKVHATAIDGCGAPVHAVSLTGLARGSHRMATASVRSPFALHRGAATIVEAVRSHPWTIAGPGQPDTVLIEELGLFSKSGAEGVIVATAPDGTTVAVKTLDGSMRVGAIVALTLLVRAEAVSASALDAVRVKLGLDVLGGGAPVGAIRATV